MQPNELDELFEKRIKKARASKRVMITAAVTLVLGIAGAAVFGISTVVMNTPAETEEPREKQSEPLPEPAPRTDAAALSDNRETGGSEEKPEREHGISMTWLDGKAPEEPVTIRIFHSGELQGEIELNAENGWSNGWKDRFDASELGLKGLFPDGASATFGIDGESFVLAGAYNDAPAPINAPESGELSDPDLPQTGVLWWPVPVLLTAGAALIAGAKKLT